MTVNATRATYWHPEYMRQARAGFPAITEGHDLAVGFKLTHPDGTTHGGYYWPLVNGDNGDYPILHEAYNWQAGNDDACPTVEGDGLCIATALRTATSGGVRLPESIGHVLVYPPGLARSRGPDKCRAPWVIDVDCFAPMMLIRAGFVANLRGAELQHADLWGAELQHADLRAANLWHASASSATVWPDGFNAEAAGVTVR